MMRRAIKSLRDFLVGIVREGVAQPVQPKPVSAHVGIMKLSAAGSLIADGETVERAASAVGIDPADLQRWLDHHRVPRRAYRR